MKTNEFINKLKATNLKTLYVGSDEDAAEHNMQIEIWLNLAIIDIYKTLFLKQDVFQIDVTEDTSLYDLPENFMIPIDCFNEDLTDLPMNNQDIENSILFTEPFKVYIPSEYREESVFIAYNASPKWVSGEDRIQLGDQYMMAIMYFISYLAFETVNTELSGKWQSYYQKYIGELDRLKQSGLTPSENIINKKIIVKGFV